MKNNLRKIFSEKIPYYYYYVCKKKEEGYEHLTLQQIAEDFNIKSRTTICRDFNKWFPLSGRKNYGYNTVFLKNRLKELMSLSEVCNFCVVGNIESELLKDNFDTFNFHLTGQIDSCDPVYIENNNIKMVIATKQLNADELEFLSSTVAGIINLSGVPITGLNIPVYNLNLLELLIGYWFEGKAEKNN